VLLKGTLRFRLNRTKLVRDWTSRPSSSSYRPSRRAGSDLTNGSNLSVVGSGRRAVIRSGRLGVGQSGVTLPAVRTGDEARRLAEVALAACPPLEPAVNNQLPPQLPMGRGPAAIVPRSSKEHSVRDRGTE
jgi:hypothetical protein